MKTSFLKAIPFVGVLIPLILAGCGTSVVESTLPSVIVNTPTQTLTPTETLEPTATLTATETPVPTATSTPTSTPDIAATQKYDNMLVWVEKLANDKVIPSREGEYIVLEDTSMEFAKIGYYTWELYGRNIHSNFVMQANVKIANEASENAFKSACGFIFKDDFDGHAVFFSLDGNVNYRTDGSDRGSNYLDSALFQDPDGVKLTLVLSNKSLTFYINDRKALSGIVVYGGPFAVGTTVLSSTSEGFGTRCDFTEVALWRME